MIITSLKFSERSSSVAFVSFLLGFLLLSTGCDSTSLISETPPPSTQKTITTDEILKPSVIDDRITFEDSYEFRDFMASIINAEDSYLDSIESVINFISLRTDTDQLSKRLEKDVDELEIVEDPFLQQYLMQKVKYKLLIRCIK